MLTLPPVKGEISLAGVLPFAGVGGSSRTRVIVVVVVVVVIAGGGGDAVVGAGVVVVVFVYLGDSRTLNLWYFTCLNVSGRP